ncbi:hypothetical protein [Streptomyces sp. Inha503]|uniref:hypothetical protein n=1 Tax=Streptomyces sp. Inha503 TaxID=3383314 RepID=UPI0039A1DE35
MANTYGGLIMVGIVDKAEADKKGCDRVVGADAQETEELRIVHAEDVRGPAWTTAVDDLQAAFADFRRA